MASLVLSPKPTNQDFISNLIAVLACLRNVIFNQSKWNFLVSTREVLCLVRLPTFSSGRVTLPKAIHSLLDAPPTFPYKAFHLAQLLGPLFSVLDVC